MAAHVQSQRRLKDCPEIAAHMAPEFVAALLQDITAHAASWVASGQPTDHIRIENIWLDDQLRPAIVPNDASAEVVREAPGLQDLGDRDAERQRAAAFQLGGIACELLTGENADAYLMSPRVKQRIPSTWRPLLDRMLGFDPANRLATLDELLAELKQLVAQHGAAETPPRGTVIGAGNTPMAIQNATRQGGTKHGAEPIPFATLGHYRIEAKIGSGGMGDVYRGFEPALERTVALKVLPADLGRQPDFVRRFEEEAKAAAQLVHPNIVQIYFIGEDAGRHFFAMQYVEGESLAARLSRDEKLSLEEGLGLIEQVLEGLSVAHRRSMIHRDIKPSNILVDKQHGRALLADFGLVKSLDAGTQMTATGMVMGTVDYISPEQGRGLPVDARSDLYSVGVLMYQLLSGRLPFESDSATAMIFQHAYERPRLLTDVAPHLPPGVSRLVHRLLEKNPCDRYANAEELLVDIRGLRVSRDYEPQRLSANATADPSAVSSTDWTLNDADEQLTAVFAPLPSQSWRDRLLAWLPHRGRELFKHLQNTQQQIDGALGIYQLRCDQLARLEVEATVLAKELSVEIQDRRHAGYDDSLGELERAFAEQQSRLEDLRLRRARADATLKKLRNQHAILEARLKVAASANLFRRPGDQKKTGHSFQRAVMIAALTGATIIAFFLFRSSSKTETPPNDPSRANLTDLNRLTPSSGWMDLLAIVDLSKDALSGDWKPNDEGLKLDNPSGAKRLQLPVEIDGAYEFRMQFTRGSGAPNRGVSVRLPVGTGRMAVVLGQVRGNGIGIGGMRRLDAFDRRNPLSDRTIIVEPSVKHDLLVRVDLKGTSANISVEFDGVQRIQWSGKQAELNAPNVQDSLPGASLPVIAGWGNDVTFHEAHLRMTDGAATLIRDGNIKKAPEELPPRQLNAPTQLDGYFHVACKGAFELLVNGRSVFTNAEQAAFAGTSPLVTLKQNDVISVRVTSKYVYRAIRLAFVDVNRKWLWSARREDFRVLNEAEIDSVNAASIDASKQLPEFGRIDSDSVFVDRWDSLIENDSSNWLWAGGKNEWAMFATVIRPGLFAPHKIVIPAYRSRWEPPQNAGAVINGPGDEGGPFLSRDALTLLFHSDRDGGRGSFDLYVSRRDATDQAWREPELLGEAINTSDADIFPRMSADGLTLLFCSTRDGGLGRRDIYQSVRSSVDEAWGDPTPMEPPLNTEFDDGPVWLSHDGLTLWFSSDRPGGQGRYDIWRTQRTSLSQKWNEPVNLRPLNTGGDQKHPTASADGEVIMIDARWKSGFGQADLWTWRRPKAPLLGSALNLGAAINTSAMDADPTLSTDGRSLWFASNRPGGRGKLDIWFASAGRSAP